MPDEHDDQRDDDQRDDDGDAGAPATPPAATAGAPATIEDAIAALDRERAELAEVRREAAKRRSRERELEAELETIRAAGLTESERALAEAKRAGADERDAEWRERYLREAVTAAAGGKMRDPDDAYGLLEAAGATRELRELEPDAMRDAARSHVERLVEAKPYLGPEVDELSGRPLSGALTPGVRDRQSAGGQGDDSSDWLRRSARKRAARGG
jgi:hypothetical protein